MMEIRKGYTMRTKKQQGAVSIFVVIFAMLLFTAVSVGFTVLMLRDQNRATDNDLSQSALDSSRAGIEDAKRVLAQYNECLDTSSTEQACTELVSKVRLGECDTVGSVVGSAGAETRIKQSEDDKQLEQAYTCVKIQPDTEDVVKLIKDEGDIKIIPLKAKDNDFDSVEISWVEKGVDDFDFSLTAKNGLKTHSSVDKLPTEGEWNKEKWGSVLRVQAFNYTPGSVNLNTIDSTARTAFLYPSNVGTPKTTIDMKNAAVDSHTPLPPADAPPEELGASALDAAYNKPQSVSCKETLGPDDDYACTAILKNVRSNSSETAYLTVAGIYANAGDAFKVRMLKSSGQVAMFDGVQPIIDSTGRANDVFRRVQARVETSSSQEDAMPLPRAALGARGAICKNYTVTDSDVDYVEASCAEGAPNPTQQPNSATPDGSALVVGGGGAGSGGGGVPGGTGGDTPTGSIPAPYTMMIGGKEYTITPRLKVEQECTGILWNRTCKDVRYAEHVYTATEERCTGPFWNRTCKDTQVEKIHKREKL